MSEFGALFQEGAGILHSFLGSTKTATYTPPVTQSIPSPAAQTLTEVIIGDVEKKEPDESQQTGSHLYVYQSITIKRSEVTRFSNKGFVTIDGESYAILNYVEDEEGDQIHIRLDHIKRTQITGPNYIRKV